MDDTVTREQLQKALRERHTQEVQEKLDKARVAVARLGGLGSHVAAALARIGVGHLHLVDFDVVDITNLNRQQYTARHLGTCKTDALADALREINPYLDIYTDRVKVTEDNLVSLFSGETIICEAFDCPQAKAMLANGILTHFPGKYLVAASGMAGFGSSNTVITRKAGKNFYLCGDGISDPASGAGLMAPRVMLCAAHQANMIVRLILGEEDP